MVDQAEYHQITHMPVFITDTKLQYKHKSFFHPILPLIRNHRKTSLCNLGAEHATDRKLPLIIMHGFM